MEVDIIITGGTILTINSENEVVSDGAIAVKDKKIFDIGNSSEINKKYTSEQLIDAKGKIIMPGLVNTHTHAAMTVFRGIADDIKLKSWLMDYIFPAEAKYVTAELVRKGVRLAAAEMIFSGTTTFNDMYYFEDETAEASKELGIRACVAEGLIDFAAPNSPTFENGIEYTKFLLRKYKNDDLINVFVSIHAPYTCSADLIKGAKKLADEHETMYHVHLAESKWESKTVKKKYGYEPVKYMNKLNVLDKNTIAAHSVWLSDEDIEIYKNTGTSAAHNPECNMKISSGAARIPELLKKGVKIGLGTDGAGSNNNLNMFEELHTAALLHKLMSDDPTVLPADEVIRIATMGGAEVLGLSDKIGSLEIGKLADIITVNVDTLHSVPIYDPFSTLVYSASGSDVTDVIINGKSVLKNRILLTADTEKLKTDVMEISVDIKENIFKKNNRKYHNI